MVKVYIAPISHRGAELTEGKRRFVGLLVTGYWLLGTGYWVAWVCWVADYWLLGTGLCVRKKKNICVHLCKSAFSAISAVRKRKEYLTQSHRAHRDEKIFYVTRHQAMVIFSLKPNRMLLSM